MGEKKITKMRKTWDSNTAFKKIPNLRPALLTRPTSLKLKYTSKPLRALVQTHEIEQVVNEAGFIAGVSGVMFSITLIGLALGLVLIRIESLVEEGKIDL